MGCSPWGREESDSTGATAAAAAAAALYLSWISPFLQYYLIFFHIGSPINDVVSGNQTDYQECDICNNLSLVNKLDSNI